MQIWAASDAKLHVSAECGDKSLLSAESGTKSQVLNDFHGESYVLAYCKSESQVKPRFQAKLQVWSETDAKSQVCSDRDDKSEIYEHCEKKRSIHRCKIEFAVDHVSYENFEGLVRLSVFIIIITQLLNVHLSLKVNVVLEAEFVLRDEVSVKSFSTRNDVLFQSSNLRRWYAKDVIPTLLTSIEEIQERDSGWALSKILHLLVNSNKYQPLQAGCQVSVPRTVQLKKAVLNVYSNHDNACFYWAVVASLYPAKNNLNRTSSYPHYIDVLRIEGFQLPTLFKDISKKREKHVNLLLIHDSENLRNHYLCIRNLSRLVLSQISTQHNKYICDRCLQYFRSQEKLNIHEIDCSRMNECALKLPTEDDKWLKFKNYAYKEPTPFVIYADLKCMLETQRDQGHGAYCRYQHHHAFSVDYYLHYRYDSSLSEYRAYRDEKGCIACHCNLSYQSSYVIPVVFHNLSGYDAHFFIKELANAFESKIDALPLTKEKYISFTKHTKRNNDVTKSWKKCIKFRFIDSFKFLNSSLRIVRSQFNRLSNDDFHLLTRKGVFRYDYVTTYKKLSDTCLPPREAFYNQLCDSEIFDVDYSHVNEVWSRFGRQTLGQYSDFYLMYFDVNNLYGWAMSQPLPHRGFQSVDDMSNFNIDSVPIDSPVGYILEVDLEYPQEIHDSHADLPLCPIREVGVLQKKLLTTLSDKNRYVLHYRYLQQCLR
ncbi:uncharacterized protein LOC143260904 [Megalopta genalis]|uniref:uncharacterized protein LOC143260904 n=1 Tax=Megalopta genalis TaxID=115081 RepID=UPI003FCFEA38